MPPARALLALAATLLAVCAARAKLDKCTTISRGYCKGPPIKPPLTILDSEVVYAQVIILDRCEARGQWLASQVVTVCDADSEPILYLPHLFNLFVTRTGQFDSKATVNVTQYCG